MHTFMHKRVQSNLAKTRRTVPFDIGFEVDDTTLKCSLTQRIGQ